MISLDVGCGAVECTRQRGEVKIDIQKHHTKKLEDFILADAHYLPFQNSIFEKTFFYEVIEHVHTPIQCLREIRRVLMPNGTVEVSTPNPFHWRNCLMAFRGKEVHGDNPEHIAVWFPEILITLLHQAGFNGDSETVYTMLVGKTPHLRLDRLAAKLLPGQVGGYNLVVKMKKLNERF